MRLTREGRRFLLATFLIAVAAVNTGNNLIYLILSLMLSFTLLSYIILRLNLSGISLEVSLSGPVFAGDSVPAELLVMNRKSIPSYSLNIESNNSPEGAYCGIVPGRSAVRLDIRLLFRRRGLSGYGDLFIRSGFPFILFHKKVPADAGGRVLVYPALLEMDKVIDSLGGGLEELGDRPVRGRGEEVHSLRLYQYGDDWRRIHWKISARQTSLFVREYAAYISRKVSIMLDNSLPEDETQFEKAVSAAATLSGYFTENGFNVRLISCGKLVPFGSGDEHLFTMLDMLALVKEEGCASADPDDEGLIVAVMKSARSSMKLTQSEGIVLYADSL